MHVRVKSFWYQKHPTPSRPHDVRFKWFPAVTADEEDLFFNARPTGSRATGWLIDPDKLVWIRSFESDGAGSDTRRYTGLNVLTAHPDDGGGEWARALPALLSLVSARLGSTGPCASAATEQRETVWTLSEEDLKRLEECADLNPLLPYRHLLPALALATFNGGAVAVNAADSPALADVLGRLISWLPLRDRCHSRSGTFDDAAVSATFPPPGARRIGDYLAATWEAAMSGDAKRAALARKVWRCFASTLGAGCEIGLERLIAQLDEVAVAFDPARPRELQRYLKRHQVLGPTQAEGTGVEPPPERAWRHLLAHWGFGHMPWCTAESLGRIVLLLVLRDHLARLLDPDFPNDELRHFRTVVCGCLLYAEAKAIIESAEDEWRILLERCEYLRRLVAVEACAR